MLHNVEHNNEPFSQSCLQEQSNCKIICTFRQKYYLCLQNHVILPFIFSEICDINILQAVFTLYTLKILPFVFTYINICRCSMVTEVFQLTSHLVFSLLSVTSFCSGCPDQQFDVLFTYCSSYKIQISYYVRAKKKTKRILIQQIVPRTEVFPILCSCQQTQQVFFEITVSQIKT